MRNSFTQLEDGRTAAVFRLSCKEQQICANAQHQGRHRRKHRNKETTTTTTLSSVALELAGRELSAHPGRVRVEPFDRDQPAIAPSSTSTERVNDSCERIRFEAESHERFLFKASWRVIQSKHTMSSVECGVWRRSKKLRCLVPKRGNGREEPRTDRRGPARGAGGSAGTDEALVVSAALEIAS